ncbi:MAG: hypothetical protein KGD63_11420 [Candidatus Lokiarchaeota archaeon]|nr:hypothetical protein [Candidatus Lokiarchaeota archaeon]
MEDKKLEVTYFQNKGFENTEKTLEIAKNYAKKHKIEDIIIASTTGSTAKAILNKFNMEEFNIVVVTHSYYFVGSSLRQEFEENLMEELKEKGVKILSSTHSMSGIERGLRLKNEPWIFVDLLAKVIRQQFGQGIKVCIEIASMAVDNGLISSLNNDIICIAGTGKGADTACIIKPAPTSEFMNIRVKAILCKPFNF